MAGKIDWRHGKTYLGEIGGGRGCIVGVSRTAGFWLVVHARPNTGPARTISDRVRIPVAEILPSLVQYFARNKLPIHLIEDIDWKESESRQEMPANSRPERRTPSVYFIRPVGGGNIKIGWAFNCADRFRKIQLMSPVELEVVGTIPGGQPIESELHIRFQHLRLHGEWFSACPDLLDFILKETIHDAI